MHTGGEPVRIIKMGIPEPHGSTILEKRKFMKEFYDDYRKYLMFEPRGHSDMYGALLVKPNHPDADLGVLFMHNEGYSTMCGHATIALARYAVDEGLVSVSESGFTPVSIECPCGLVNAFYDKNSGRSSFISVPAFLYEQDVVVPVGGSIGDVKVDISYGGAFYALVNYSSLNLTPETANTEQVRALGTTITNYLRQNYKVTHPEEDDLSFIYGTIIIDTLSENKSTSNVCIFAESSIDRSPCGSGVTARIACLVAKENIGLKEAVIFRNSLTKSEMIGQAIERMKCGKFEAVRVKVEGRGFYSGRCEFQLEDDDLLGKGFLI
ncbi:unnamed protein product [Dimorphilus gyrociliatus]|uniref:trans-L-3-hydroxyproline dehydratase n=1 Tax=Dimorphilus gyrociliatus TaxID=2664684 RepID=A0A7I8W1C6_9ANNE|nr:unnamed protein product [Dimorphilus gyrociliatus]